MVGGCIIPRRDSHLLQLYAFLQKLILMLAEPPATASPNPWGSVEPSLRTTELYQLLIKNLQPTICQPVECLLAPVILVCKCRYGTVIATTKRSFNNKLNKIFLLNLIIELFIDNYVTQQTLLNFF